jgi:hypothetical protein
MRPTATKRLVLARHQKIRGKLYLFAAYEVRTGRVRWMFLPAKDSPQVCAFMRRVHRCYPEMEVWGVLDQDGAHPGKSHLTRPTMRELKLHWVSLPKGSPDDNPVATLFSDIQLMSLDNSNDADSHTLQRCISRYFQQRNRRTNRFIKVAYLGDSHKN